jgi:hypothetical protein
LCARRFYGLDIDQEHWQRFKCGSLNPFVHSIYGGFFLPAHMTLEDLAAGARSILSVWLRSMLLRFILFSLSFTE